MTDRIKVSGPVPYWMDPETDEDGVVVDGYWVQSLSVEAVGTDGQVHGRNFYFSADIAAEFVQSFVDGAKMLLKASMEDDNVW